MRPSRTSTALPPTILAVCAKASKRRVTASQARCASAGCTSVRANTTS